MKLEILVTTMYQSDFSIIDKMHIKSDAIIANQSDENSYNEIVTAGKSIKVISTTSRGVSRNRNIALAHADQNADLILFLDDDLILNDNYESLIIGEFEKHPEADAIKFNIHDLSETRKISMKRIEKFEKCSRRNMSASGVCGVVLKQSIIKKFGLHFHENFGPGTENYCGEDTIFIQDIIKKRVRFYRSPIDIAGIDQTESSWFKGYDEKYFTNTGKVFATIYPHLCRMLAIRSAYRFYKKKKCSLGFLRILKCYNRGISDVIRNKNKM